MRYKAIVSYDGTNYLGYQTQVKGKTIQDSIEKAFKLMTRIPTKTFAASRTDKGVHAKYQVFHFDSDIDLSSDKWVLGLNKRLDEDIRIVKVVKVKDNFHARYDAKSKLYTYRISKNPSTPFTALYEIYVPNFNFLLIRDLIKELEGTHDFSAFSPNKEGKDPIKTIYSFKAIETKTHYIFKIHGNQFLRYMVRSIMGNVIAIATNKKPINHLKIMLETKDRLKTAKTAPAKGLFLSHIYYNKIGII